MARKRSWLSRLSISNMRALYAQGNAVRELAVLYDVSETTAADICHGRTHRKVAPAPLDRAPALLQEAQRLQRRFAIDQQRRSRTRRLLTAQQIARIRGLFLLGERVAVLASAFHTSEVVIGNIVHERTHKRVAADPDPQPLVEVIPESPQEAAANARRAEAIADRLFNRGPQSKPSAVAPSQYRVPGDGRQHRLPANRYHA